MPVKHKPTEEIRKTVKALATHGITLDEIAKYIHIDKKTLLKYYKEELKEIENFHTKVITHLRQRIFKNDILLIFYAKTQLGYREKDRVLPEQSFVLEFRETEKGERLAKIEPGAEADEE